MAAANQILLRNGYQGELLVLVLGSDYEKVGEANKTIQGVLRDEIF